jgi:hypothetical protein
MYAHNLIALGSRFAVRFLKYLAEEGIDCASGLLCSSPESARLQDYHAVGPLPSWILNDRSDTHVFSQSF